MIHLTYSNDSDALARRLADHIQQTRKKNILEQAHIVVPSYPTERFLELSMSQYHGIAANYRFYHVDSFIGQWMEFSGFPYCLDVQGLGPAIVHLLSDEQFLRREKLRLFHRYLSVKGGDKEIRMVHLMLRLRNLFHNYLRVQPDMLQTWDNDIHSNAASSNEDLQKTVWNEIRSYKKERIPIYQMIHNIQKDRMSSKPLLSTVYLFGFSYCTQIVKDFLSLLFEQIDVFVYAFNPCMEFWEDVSRTSRHVDSELVVDTSKKESASSLFADDECSLLSLWGKPGCDYSSFLNEKSHNNFESCFVDPGYDSILHCLQSTILHRSVAEVEKKQCDSSIQIFACDSPRVEIERIIDHIWAQLSSDSSSPSSIRLNEICILLHLDSQGMYLPHIRCLFSQKNLPFEIVDTLLWEASPFLQGAIELMKLLRSSFQREEGIHFLMHPCLRTPRDIDRTLWPLWIEELGIVYGIDHTDHEGTYIDADILNWQQGCRRIVIGAFTGEGNKPFEFKGHHYFPKEAVDRDSLNTLAIMIQSLVEDARFVRTHKLSLKEWSDYITSLFRSYLTANTPSEHRVMFQCMKEVKKLAEYNVEKKSFGFAAASEIIISHLYSMYGFEGEYFGEGVLVASLSSMRIIPFKVIYVVGMGEMHFPSTDVDDSLDVRDKQKKQRDIKASERDMYVFLSSLMCAKVHFCASWTCCDDQVEPSKPLKDLIHYLSEYIVWNSSELVEKVGTDDTNKATGLSLEESKQQEAKVLGREMQRSLGFLCSSNDVVKALNQGMQGHVSNRKEIENQEYVRDLLKLMPLPQATNAILRCDFPLRSLIDFLENPALGWTKHVLYLGQKDRFIKSSDESLAPSFHDTYSILSSTFQEKLLGNASSLPMYHTQVRFLQSLGRWPLGELFQKQERQDMECVGNWISLFRGLFNEQRQEIQRIVFGKITYPTDSLLCFQTELPWIHKPPLFFDVKKRKISLYGETRLLAPLHRGSLALIHQENHSLNIGFILRFALRAFFDYLALVISLDQTFDSYSSFLLFGKEPPQVSVLSMGSLSPAHARGYLQALIEDFLLNSHMYFFPCQVLFDNPSSFFKKDYTSYVLEKIDHARKKFHTKDYVMHAFSKRDTLRSILGKIHEYPVPSKRELSLMIDRRFGLFFQLIQPALEKKDYILS